jgi:RecB family endonuclease NucS
VRLVVARCEVTYSGRLNAYLPEAVRLLVFKADGSVLVHADSGGYKPLKWMTHRPRRPQKPFSLRSWTTPRAFGLNRSGSIR